jgi:hypothetical protein
LNQIQRASFIGEDPDRHTFPIQPSIVACHYYQGNFAAPTFLAVASACNPIGNDREASLLLSIVICGSLLESNPFCVPKSNLFLITTESCTWFRFAMAIVVALFIRARRANIRWKSEEDSYTFGIQSFLSFHFEFWSKFETVSSHQSVQHRIAAAFINCDKACLLNHQSYEGA